MPEPHFMAGGDFENVQAFVSQAPAALAEVPIHECNYECNVVGPRDASAGKLIVA